MSVAVVLVKTEVYVLTGIKATIAFVLMATTDITAKVLFFQKKFMTVLFLNRYFHCSFFLENFIECGSSPCKNGGACVDLDYGHICFCAEGYTGDHCEGNYNFISLIMPCAF